MSPPSHSTAVQVSGAIAAILGGTGNLGLFITKIFLTEYRSYFANVRITTRNPGSAKAQELAALGAQVHSLDEPLDSVLAGVDVVVNVLPPTIPGFRKELIASLVRNKTKVYFLSEFGADYKYNDFPGYELPEWPEKRAISAEIRTAVEPTGTKVIGLTTGMFLGWLFAPALGIDVEKNVYTPLGPGSVRVATTAEVDIARSVAQLAVLALDPATASSVPDELRIAGQNPSFEEIRDAVARVKGVPKGEIHGEDLKAFKDNLRAHAETSNVFDYIRVLIGEGKVDFTKNANELVNPNESLWKWKTLDEELRDRV